MNDRDWKAFWQIHTSANARLDWPVKPTEQTRDFWLPWQSAFLDEHVTLAEAREASYKIARRPLAGLSEYLPAIMAAIHESRDQANPKGGTPAATTNDRQKAEAESKNCHDCGGTGWAMRFVHEDIDGHYRTPAGNPIPAGGSFSLPCGCVLGLWFARARNLKGTVADSISLRTNPVSWSDQPDNKYRYREGTKAGQWDGEAGCVVPSDPADWPISVRRWFDAASRGEASGGLAAGLAGKFRDQPTPQGAF